LRSGNAKFLQNCPRIDLLGCRYSLDHDPIRFAVGVAAWRKGRESGSENANPGITHF